MNRASRGNPPQVSYQINAESTPPADVGPDGSAGAAADGWDRLAALAFDQTSPHEGCSAQAHECTCRAEHAAEPPHAQSPESPNP